MKINKKVISILVLSLLITLFPSNSISVIAEENVPTFELSAPKEEYNVGDIFEVSLKLKNVKFNALQVTIYFDSDIVQVVDKNGVSTEKFNEGTVITIQDDYYDVNTKEGIFAQVGASVDVSKGLIDHILYVFPSQKELDDGIYTVGQEPFHYLNIRFRAIKEGNPNIHLADDGSPARTSSNPNGYIVANGVETIECDLIIPKVIIWGEDDFFADVSNVYWAKESIERLFRMGIISGVGERRFEPDRNITREEFTKILIEAFDFNEQEGTVKFNDVDTSEWDNKYKAIAQSLEVINGIGDNKFGIGELITRQDMAVMAYRAANASGIIIPKAKEAKVFADEIKISEYAKEAVKSMHEADIINGVGGELFSPNDNATRAQAVKIIYMLLSVQ